MSNKNTSEKLLSSGTHSVYTCDPLQKDQITKSTVDTAQREIKSHLTKKRRVHLIIVKE
jgi:hypothetical protein